MACGTTAIWRLTATLQILLHVLETSLQFHSAFTYLTYDRGGPDVNPDVIAYVIIGVIALSSCITNVTSAVWTYRGMDFSAEKSGGTICAVLHLCQLGPIWRYFKLMIVGDYRDVEELFQLRILQVSLQNTAYIIIQGAILLTSSRLRFAESLLGVVVSFISVIFSFTCCSLAASSSLTFVTNFESKQSRRCPCSRTAYSAFRLISRVFRHTFMLASRLLALILLAQVLRPWILLLVIGHLLIFYVVFLIGSIVHNDRHRQELSVSKRIPEVLLFGFIEVFDHTGRLYHSNISVFIYYAVIIAENTIMGLTWYFTRKGIAHNDAILVLVFTFFTLGVITSVVSEGLLCGSESPALDDNKEENNNLDSVGSNEAFSPALQTITNKPSISPVGPSDFDLDLDDILFASSKYNPKLLGEVTVAVPSEIQIDHTEPPQPGTANRNCRDREAIHEIQTSSDSGFVSRLFDNSCFENDNDSEGYSRGATTSSGESSALGGTTETKENTTIISICTNNAAQCMEPPDAEHKISNCSITSKTSVHLDSNNLMHSRLSRASRRQSVTSENIHRIPKSWAGQTALDSLGCESETSRTSCSNSRAARIPRRHKRTFSRSRSVPNSRSRSSVGLPRHEVYSDTSDSSTEKGILHRRRLVRTRSAFLYETSSSETSSDSFFESYNRGRCSQSIGSSSWSDSQSLGDSEFGFTRTWPPGRRCSIVNLFELPIEQISVREHVISWLEGVERTQMGIPGTRHMAVTSEWSAEQKENPLRHRFDSYRDVKIAYIDSYRDMTHLSDTGLFRGHKDKMGFMRPRTLSEGGAKPRKPTFMKFCGLQIPRSGKKKWFDRKIIQRLSVSSNIPKKNVIITNRDGTYNANPHIIGLESSV